MRSTVFFLASSNKHLLHYYILKLSHLLHFILYQKYECIKFANIAHFPFLSSKSTNWFLKIGKTGMFAQIKTAGTCSIFLTLFVCFIVSGLLINGIQLCLWLTVKPISRWLYRKINYHLLSCLWNRKYMVKTSVLYLTKIHVFLK